MQELRQNCLFLSAQETSSSSVVSDTIRKVDFKTARFAKLPGTLLLHVDTTGLRVTKPDMLILLRSLPETVRSYCMHDLENHLKSIVPNLQQIFSSI